MRQITKLMRGPKSVTPGKLEANRSNAKRSTRSRTKRGMRIAKFNAVTVGLFAKYVVIPIGDGYKPERDFRSLLDGLHQEFQPAGFYEEWLVVKIGECMWRLRRGTRCESGSVRESAIWARREESIVMRTGRRDNDQRTFDLAKEIGTLIEAEGELEKSGSLSHRIYDQVAPLVEKEEQTALLA